MSLNEMVENDGGGKGSKVDLNVNPNVTTDRDQEFYDQHICGSFEDMELKDKLLRGIYSVGFEVPSAIQQKAIVPFTDNHDLIAQAQSGTGKTATFSIGLLQNLDENLDKTQAVILTHTRELALQSYNVVTALSKYMKIAVNLTIGGNSVRENIDELNNNPHVVIGTPGRILDMINKGALSTKYLQTLVVDEADEMLSKIFLNHIQVGLFSATMPTEFFSLTEKFMRNPIKILVKTEQLTLEGIEQYYINVERNEFKYDVICDLYAKFSLAQSMIYCNSKKVVDDLSNKLNDNGYAVARIHGKMTQSERNDIMKGFRNGESRILVSTDLLCRGIDIQQVSVVINYDIPQNVENYLHRIGRSGRFGRKGLAINFMTYYDIKTLREIEKYYSTQIQELPALEKISLFQ